MQWIPIPGHDGYSVSDIGEVMSFKRSRAGKLLRQIPATGGYRVVKLGNANNPKRIHRLVLEAFVGPCPEGMEACHNNDVRQDNRLENLRWDTRSANHIDAVSNGRNRQTQKAKCPQGHDYSKENTVVWMDNNGRPHRRCRICQNGPRPSRQLLDGEDA